MARAQKTMTYGQLMKSYRLSRGRQLSQVIEKIDKAECQRGAPGFAAMIVRKDTGFPGGGYFCDDQLPADLVRSRDRSTYPRLSVPEKKHVLERQRMIWAYYRRDQGARQSGSTT